MRPAKRADWLTSPKGDVRSKCSVGHTDAHHGKRPRPHHRAAVLSVCSLVSYFQTHDASESDSSLPQIILYNCSNARLGGQDGTRRHPEKDCPHRPSVKVNTACGIDVSLLLHGQQHKHRTNSRAEAVDRSHVTTLNTCSLGKLFHTKQEGRSDTVYVALPGRPACSSAHV